MFKQGATNDACYFGFHSLARRCDLAVTVAAVLSFDPATGSLGIVGNICTLLPSNSWTVVEETPALCFLYCLLLKTRKFFLRYRGGSLEKLHPRITPVGRSRDDHFVP